MDHGAGLGFGEAHVSKSLVVLQGVPGRCGPMPGPFAKIRVQVGQASGLCCRESGIEKSLKPFPRVAILHGARTLLHCLGRIATFRPDFETALRRASAFLLALSLALSLAIPPAALAQSGPLGSEAAEQAGQGAGLGECRRDLLLDAWNEMGALEAAAVEDEVIAICAERTELIARLVEQQSRLDGALAVLRAPGAAPPVAAPAPAVADDRVDTLRQEIASLRTRIAVLEGEPEGPETAAALAELRAELVTAQADLERIEDPGVAGTAAPEDDLPPVLGETDGEIAPAVPAAPPVVAGLSRSVDDLIPPLMRSESPFSDVPQAEAEAEVLGDRGSVPDDPLAPPGAAPAGREAALDPEDSVQVRNRAWQVIHAVRSDGGEWEIRLQATREEAAVDPDPLSENPGSAVVPPFVRWFPVLDPPVTRAVGEVLPDGLTVLAVTSDGVELGNPEDPDSAPTVVPFATGDESAPGTADWEFAIITEDGG